jgi:hypothetical protein
MFTSTSDPAPAADLEITTDEYGREYQQFGPYRYQLRSTGYGSARFGPCEVCGEYCPEVYAQTRQRVSRMDWRDEADGIGKTGEVVWIDNGAGSYGHRDCLEARRCWLSTDYPAIQRWLDGHLEADIAARADKLLADDPQRTPAYARAVAGAMLVLGWSRERERLEETVEHAAMNSSLSADLEAFYTQVYEAEETPSPRGGSGYVNDVIDLSGNRAIWEDVDTLRAGRMP